jgi:purine nucleosidase
LPVFAGAARPLDRPLRTARAHGDNGLGGLDLPLPGGDIPNGAVDRLIALLDARPGEITLCPIGPMTNLALAERARPGILKQARRIVAMGGAAGPGNVTPHAEFNFFVDPPAAAEVFASGAEIVMFGLDVTRQVPVRAEHLAAMAAIGTASAAACAAMVRNYAHGDPLLHDPCVIAWLIDPGLFAGRPARVDVDPGSGARAGESRVDFAAPAVAHANALVMEQARTDDVFALLIDRLARLP